jgi:tetratricopeptide (TPR) repeat protein
MVVSTSDRLRALLILALLALASPSAGQVRFPRSLAQPPAPQWSAVDQAVGKENYLEAKKQADAILQRGTPEDRQKTMLVYGRILLGLGQTDQARQYLNMLSKSGASVGAKAAIYGAWLKALEKKPDEAIKTLEKMLQQAGGAPDETTAEAADVLAMLYMAHGEKETAKKAVDFGLKCLQYHGIKGGYVLTLLQGRLNSDFAAGEAKQLYNKAEKLRQQGKFVEAGQLFAQVLAAYPKNPWGHASGFRIGQCYVGLGRAVQAMDWWQKFIKQSPAGPWRGQAHVAMVDLVLETQLDLKKATEHALAATTVLAKGLDKDAEPSWKEATYDIYLRQGIVSLVDGRFDAAAEGFQQAKQSAPKGTSSEVQAGLDRLIESAQNRVKLLPDELTIGDDRGSVALVLGSIYSVLRQYDLAKGWFSLPLNGSLRSRSAGHRSFAGLGLAGAVIASGQPVSGSRSPGSQPSPLLQAKAICEASLAEYPKGSWHDETLFRLATVIQDVAEAKYGKSPSSTADAKKPTQPAKLPGPQQRDAKAEKERSVALAKAKAEALPYWQEIIDRFPKSPRCEQAMYSAGVLLYGIAEAGSGDTSDDRWSESAAMLKRFCAAYPKSPYSGDAYVRQMDIALERMFDPKAALTVSAEAGEWARWAIGVPALDMPKASAWALVVKYPDNAEIRRSVYDCLLRLGIVAYLAGDFDKAAHWIDIAGPKPPTPGFVANRDLDSLTLYYLQKAVRSKKPLTDKRALDAAKTDEQRLLVRLGDVYLETIRPEKAEKVFLRIVQRDPKLGKVSVALQGYAMLQMATTLDRQPGRRPEALACLKKLATRPDLQGTYWAGYGLFRLALFTYNQTQDARQSMPLYVEMLKRYPKHEMAELAYVYCCMDAIQLKDTALAEKIGQSFLANYPKSEYRPLLEKQMAAIATTTANNNPSR